MRKLLVLLSLLFVTAVPSIAATYYISVTSGTAGGTGTANDPYDTQAHATAAHGAGNLYIFMDGSYSAAWSDTTMTTGTLTAWTTFQAEHDGGAIITGGIAMRDATTPIQTHIDVEGFKFYTTAQFVLYGDHLKFKRCAWKHTATTSGNSAEVQVGGNDNGTNLTRFVLLEDNWIWGIGGRYKALTFNAENIVWRRAVVRQDHGYQYDGSDPEAGFATYNSSNVVIEDLYLLDQLSNFGGGYSGGWYFIRNTSAVPPHSADAVRAYGFIGINIKDNCWRADADGALGMTMQDAVCVNPGALSFSVNGTGSTYSWNRLGGARHLVTNYLTPDGNSGGFYNGGGLTLTNVIVSSMTAAGDADFSSVTPTNFDTFNNTNSLGSGTGRQTYNPHTNGWLYPVRIEAASNLITAGTSGGSMGPKITTKWGTDDANYGDTGYETDTGNALWPWPNESRIKTDLCVDSTITWGLCGTTVTVTKYIWESFGNPIPADIYGTDVTSPTAPTNVSTTSVSTSTFGCSWTAATDAVGVTDYRLDVSSVSSMNPLLSGHSDQTLGVVTSTTVVGLVSSTTYYFVLRAKDAAGNTSVNSSTQTAITGTDTTAPTAATNLSTTSVTTSSILWSWTAATDAVGVTSYRVDVDDDPAFGSPVSGYNDQDIGNVNTLTVTGLSASTQYFIRLRAKDAAGNTSTNATGNGTTASPSTLRTFIRGNGIFTGSGRLQ